MISEGVKGYVKNLVLSSGEYKYYVAYTNSNIGGGNNDEPDLFIVLSNKPIQATSRYSYSFTGDCVCYGIRTYNASTYYHSSRITDYPVNDTLTINNYEFVYTNAEFTTMSLQPDLLADNTVHPVDFQGVSIALFIVLITVCVFRFLRGS